MKIRINFETKLTLFLGIITLSVTFFTIFLYYRVIIREVTLAFGNNLVSIVTSASMKINGDEFDTIRKFTSFSETNPPDVASLILESPEKVFWEGEKKRVSVLFASIRGIDELSQKTSPEELIGFLNGYLSLTSSLILNNKGLIDKFIGDKIMALFRAPISFGRDEEMAVKTSVLIKEQLRDYISPFNQKYGTKLKVSIGINTGEAIIGNVGSEKRLEYTAIGDTVNTASRIEELNKKYDSTILVSEAVIEKLKDFCRMRPVDAVKIRGKITETRIFEILDCNK